MDSKMLSMLRGQKDWLCHKIEEVQKNEEYCSINIRVEKGVLTVFKKERTELVPKKFDAK